MKVLVVGGSGFIGQALVAALKERGNDVSVSGRSAARLSKALPAGVQAVEWDPMSGPIPAEHVAGVDAVVNLAGDNVAKGRWSKKKKALIRDSRIVGTRNLVEGLAAAGSKPAVLVNASAIGYYGDRKHNAVYENSLPADDFLAEVCRDWEAEAAKARGHSIRTAIVRIGVVLGKGGGAYPLMTRPFRMFVGGMIGQGLRWMSWVHIDDVVGLILHCLDNANADAVYNATAPHPVSNAEWTETLAAALRRPAFFPVPPFALKTLLGGFADVVLSSQKVTPLRTLALGYAFKWPRLREAIENLEGKRDEPSAPSEPAGQAA